MDDLSWYLFWGMIIALGVMFGIGWIIVILKGVFGG
jgi:hypothetical protein